MVPQWKRNGAGVPAPTGFRIVRMYEQTTDAQNGSDASNNEQTTFVDYRGRGDSTQSHRPEDDAVIMTDGGRDSARPAVMDDGETTCYACDSPITHLEHGRYLTCQDCGAKNIKPVMADGGEAGCPHGHPYCEGAGSPAEKPELCFDCWDEWAAYEPEMLDEANQWDPETDERPRVKGDYDAGSDAGIVEDTCAIPNCDDEPIEGERRGMCPDHAADDAVDRGEDIMTDGGAKSVEFTAPGESIGTEVEPGTVIELPYNGGMWTVSAVKEPAVTRITEYHVEPVTGGEGQVWKEYDLENAFDAGASIIGGES